MFDEHASAIDAVGVAVGKTATFGGGASAFFFGLTANETAAIIGAVTAVIGLCIQVYYNRRRDSREVELHAAKLERWRADDDDAER